MPMVTRIQEWNDRVASAHKALRDARLEIERCTELAGDVVGTMLWQSANCLEGSAALLREADGRFRQIDMAEAFTGREG